MDPRCEGAAGQKAKSLTECDLARELEKMREKNQLLEQRLEKEKVERKRLERLLMQREQEAAERRLNEILKQDEESRVKRVYEDQGKDNYYVRYPVYLQREGVSEMTKLRNEIETNMKEEDEYEIQEPREVDQRRQRAVCSPESVKFAGKPYEEWEYFEQDFRRWLALEQIQGGSEKMFSLGTALEGRAKQYFYCIRQEAESFDEVFKALRIKFARNKFEMADVALRQLNTVQQSEDESFEMFEDRVTHLVFRAYPTAQDDERVRQTILAFTHGIFDRSLRCRMMEGYFESMEEVRASLIRCFHAKESSEVEPKWKLSSYKPKQD